LLDRELGHRVKRQYQPGFNLSQVCPAGHLPTYREFPRRYIIETTQPRSCARYELW
jgi:hypothetical protein